MRNTFGIVKFIAMIGAVCATATAVTGCSYSENSYWYCWDQGDKAPHHLGHYVAGDHVCEDAELKGTGFSPR
jgi:hypothetical protein